MLSQQCRTLEKLLRIANRLSFNKEISSCMATMKNKKPHSRRKRRKKCVIGSMIQHHGTHYS
jgi:hypothetical protein